MEVTLIFIGLTIIGWRIDVAVEHIVAAIKGIRDE